MNAVSTAHATVAAGLGALLAGAPEGSGREGAQEKASSFGAALVWAERMLDAGAEMTIPADAGAAVPSPVAVLGEGDAGEVPAEGAREGQPAPDAALSTAIAVFTTPPIAPVTEPAPPLASAEGAIPDDGQAAPAPQPALVADASHRTDADAPMLPVPLSRAQDIRASDTRATVSAPMVAAAPAVAADTPIARAVSAPVSSPTASGASEALPIAPAATTMSKDGSARPDQAAPQTQTQLPATSATAPAVTVAPVSTPIVTSPDAAAPTPRAVAAQVAPVVLSIVQRPVGTHQLTMTVNPDTFGPVTVRAHISAGGEVRVELLGATDAGREALRTIVTDLRRDLAAVMPHANLTLGSSTAGDAGSLDRGAQSGTGGAGGDHASDERGRAPSEQRSTPDTRVRGISAALPTTTRAVFGEGLDIFA